MELWFCTTFRKTDPEGEDRIVRLSVHKEGEIWKVMQQGDAPDADDASSVLYEGSSTAELAEALRGRMRRMRGHGFVSATEEWFGRNRRAPDRKEEILQWYAAGHCNDACLRLLRAWRRGQAAKEGRPAFMVATNGMLEAAAAFLPRTAEELGQLPGFGIRKVREYGSAVLEITSQFRRQTDFPLDWVERLVDESSLQAFLEERRRRNEDARTRRASVRRALAEAAASGVKLETMEEAVGRFGLSPRRLLEAMETLDREGNGMWPMIEKLVESVPESERNRVFAAMDVCGDRYLKPVLQAAYSADELKTRALGEWYDRLRLLRLARRCMPAPG